MPEIECRRRSRPKLGVRPAGVAVEHHGSSSRPDVIDGSRAPNRHDRPLVLSRTVAREFSAIGATFNPIVNYPVVWSI